MKTDDQHFAELDLMERETDAATAALESAWYQGLANPQQPIPTPAFGLGRSYTKFVDVLQDELAGADAEPHWLALVSVLHECAEGRGGHAMGRIKAQALMTTLAQRYVHHHLADMIDGCRE